MHRSTKYTYVIVCDQFMWFLMIKYILVSDILGIFWIFLWLCGKFERILNVAISRKVHVLYIVCFFIIAIALQIYIWRCVFLSLNM